MDSEDDEAVDDAGTESGTAAKSPKKKKNAAAGGGRGTRSKASTPRGKASDAKTTTTTTTTTTTATTKEGARTQTKTKTKSEERAESPRLVLETTHSAMHAPRTPEGSPELPRPSPTSAQSRKASGRYYEDGTAKASTTTTTTTTATTTTTTTPKHKKSSKGFGALSRGVDDESVEEKKTASSRAGVAEAEGEEPAKKSRFGIPVPKNKPSKEKEIDNHANRGARVAGKVGKTIGGKTGEQALAPVGKGVGSAIDFGVGAGAGIGIGKSKMAKAGRTFVS